MKLTRCNPTGYAPAQVADFDQWLRHPFASFPAFGGLLDLGFTSAAPARLATDVYEDADNYYARFEVLGVKKEDVKVELHDHLLTVSAEKRDKSAEGEQAYSLSRSVSVPDSVDPDRIGAKLEDGLLTVTLPKQEQRKPRTIQVG
jgi:HSP20 family protein